VGKTELKPDTEFFKALQAMQHYSDGSSFICALGGATHPGTFMCAPSGDTLMSAFLVESLEEPKKKSDDLTCRSGVTLNKEPKSLLEFMVKECRDLI
jgi:hypothetical protein